MNATRLPGWCEFHAEVTIAVARVDQRQREGAARGIGFRRVRGQTARGVCSKQFQLTCWNWNRTRTRVRPADSRLVDATTSRTTWAFLRPSVALPHFSSSKFAVTLFASANWLSGETEKLCSDESWPRNCAIFLRTVRYMYFQMSFTQQSYLIKVITRMFKKLYTFWRNFLNVSNVLKIFDIWVFDFWARFWLIQISKSMSGFIRSISSRSKWSRSMLDL